MDDLTLIRNFREICGAEEGEGFMLPVSSLLSVPNFINSDHATELPQIIIRPFITRRQGAQTTIYCGEDEERLDIKYNYARFQIDIYSAKIVELMQIRQSLINRIDDFMQVEIIVYKEDYGWNAIGPNTYLNEGYDSSRKIAKLRDPLANLQKVGSAEEVEDTNGSWFLDDSGLYINPLIDLESVEIFEILNGQTFSNGDTAFDRGIQTIATINDRMLKDEAPQVERWSIDLMISFRETREMNKGSILEELRIYGKDPE